MWIGHVFLPDLTMTKFGIKHDMFGYGTSFTARSMNFLATNNEFGTYFG